MRAVSRLYVPACYREYTSAINTIMDTLDTENPTFQGAIIVFVTQLLRDCAIGCDM